MGKIHLLGTLFFVIIYYYTYNKTLISIAREHTLFILVDYLLAILWTINE